ncbi:WD40 repeat domain-containing protein [Sulfurimonas sp.]
MKIVKTKNFNEAIVLTKILDDGSLLVVDSKTTIRYLNKDTLDLAGGFKANIKHLRYKSSVVAFSNDGEVFATLSSDCKESRLYNAKTKKAITKVDRHHGEASCVGIDNTGKYMFSCGDDGKTFAMDIKSGKLAFTLPVHVDTVNDIAFSSNGNWVATCSYDRKVSVFHLAMMTPKHKLKSHATPVMKITFVGQNKLFSVDKNANGIIWNIYSGKVIARLVGIHDDVTQVLAVKEDKFLFLGTALGYVLVYDLDTYEQLSKKYIKLTSSITALAFDDENNNLIVSTEDGDVNFYDIYEGENHLKQLLTDKKYDSMQSFVDENPLLAYTKIYDVLSNLWDNTMKKATICLQKGDKKTAIALFSYFKNIPAKNRIMQQLLNEYAEYDKFSELAKQGKIVLAYSLANKHPIYKDTPIYKSLEARWQKAFALAQKYSLDPKGTEKAREILAPYRGISEKTKLTQELFAQGEVYKRFRVAVGQKDFVIVFELIKLHPYLTEFPEYTTLMNYADTLYIKSQEFINAGDTHSAIKLLRILAEFPDFTAEIKELTTDIESKQKFFKAVKDEDIVNAYNMLDISDDLQETDDGKRLQKQWNEDLEIANGYAVEGNIAGINQTLEFYKDISSKYMSLGTVYGWCYMTQIEQAIKQKKDQSYIENGIKNYILNFGLQDQILSLYEIFIKRYPTSKLNFDLLQKGSLSMWRPSMVIDSILD